MKTIYKFPVAIMDEQPFHLPEDAELLSVVEQRGSVVLYVLADFSQPSNVRHTIKIFGTGHSINENEGYKFLDTVKMGDGILMWHIFFKKGR
ncbi:MAG: hypothetical protein KAR06_04250 [Deltaproteobacteria bacterium]|nr:hypothetical protein [Deltaproteobacteria bacterium]